MSDDVIHSALNAWATKDLPARLLATQVAKLLNCTTEDVGILVTTGILWRCESCAAANASVRVPI